MEQIPLRLLRNIAEEAAPTRFTPRQQARHERIMNLGAMLIARFGVGAFAFGRLAQALRYSTSTLRWHFADFDDLVIAILRRHLNLLTLTLAGIPQSAPDAARSRRAAYLAATRDQEGNLTSAHKILLRDRAALPADEAGAIAATWSKLRGRFTEEELCLLDDLTLSPAEIEQRLAEPPVKSPDPAPVGEIISTPTHKPMAHITRGRPALPPRPFHPETSQSLCVAAEA
ncbi:MAG TPA: TetR/AcrR family transcriptional regulator [Acetobacteraceae bacterium]|nr:TetR/AcrR family transcriptional regulator [Acetobacteraceae bacterium]